MSATDNIFGPSPTPVCPPLLAAVLSTTRGWDNNHEKLYHNFLRETKDLARECDVAGVQLEGSFKLRAGPEDFADGPSSHSASGIKKDNNSLMIIFKFYCRIDNDVTMSFEELEKKRDRMTNYEFEIFSRDFGICPKYLTRDEVNLIFKNMSFEKIQLGDSPMVYMSLDDFKDGIVRLALSMYNKPGLQRLIKAACGVETSVIDKVNYFCHQIHLDDIIAVRAILNSKGKKMQGAVNYPAIVKEDNTRIRDIMKEEVEGKKIIRNIKEEAANRQGGSSPIRKGHHINTTNNNSYQSTVSKSIGSARGSPDRPESPEGYGLGGGIKATRPSLIPEKISNLLMTRPSVAQPEADDVSVLDGSGAEDKKHVANGKKGVDEKYNSSSQILVHDDRSTDQSFLSAASKDTAELTEDYIKGMLEGYDRDLIGIVNRYCYDASRPSATSSVIKSGLPAVDLGLVTNGVDCTIYFHLTNKSKYDLHFDVTCHDLQSSNADVTTKSAIIVPGFTRSICVQFTVEHGYRSVMGSIDVHVSQHSTNARYRFRCPVFYKVSPLFDVHKVDHVQKLNALNFNALMAEHGLETKMLGLNFSTKPEKWSKTTQFTQESKKSNSNYKTKQTGATKAP